AVVYFWSSSEAQTAEDFATLKLLTDRYQDHGLEVVYVNLDSDPAQAKAFLAGRLTGGVHVFQSGGVNSSLARRYGMPRLPQTFLVGPGGIVIRHGLGVAELELEITGRLLISGSTCLASHHLRKPD